MTAHSPASGSQHDPSRSLTRSLTKMDSKTMLRTLDGSELMRIDDIVIYEKKDWVEPVVASFHRLKMSVTKNKHLRVDIVEHFTDIPLHKTIPLEHAKSLFDNYGYDLELLA